MRESPSRKSWDLESCPQGSRPAQHFLVVSLSLSLLGLFGKNQRGCLGEVSACFTWMMPHTSLFLFSRWAETWGLLCSSQTSVAVEWQLWRVSSGDLNYEWFSPVQSSLSMRCHDGVWRPGVFMHMMIWASCCRNSLSVSVGGNLTGHRMCSHTRHIWCFCVCLARTFLLNIWKWLLSAYDQSVGGHKDLDI